MFVITSDDGSFNRDVACDVVHHAKLRAARVPASQDIYPASARLPRRAGVLFRKY